MPSPSGDLAIRFTRGPIRPDNRYNWTALIQVSDGGILEATDLATVVAPPEGYQAALEIRVSADDAHWVRDVKRSFYIKSMGGQVYARIEATVVAYYQQNSAVDLHYYANPSGSRNLEFDPSKEIKVGQNGIPQSKPPFYE